MSCGLQGRSRGPHWLRAWSFSAPRRQQTGRPAVLKGQAASRAAPPAVAEEAPRTIEIAAGEDLWLVDQTAGELVACRLLNTSTVGKRVIRCFERTLPARWREGD